MLVAGCIDGLAELEKVVGDWGWTLGGGLVVCAKEDGGRINDKKRRVDAAGRQHKCDIPTPGGCIMSIGNVRMDSTKS